MPCAPIDVVTTGKPLDITVAVRNSRQVPADNLARRLVLSAGTFSILEQIEACTVGLACFV